MIQLAMQPYLENLEIAADEIIQSFDLMTTEEKTILTGDIKFEGPYLISTVGLVGNCEGLFTAFFPRDTALVIAGKMFQMQFTEVTDDVRDAIGEVCNMIVGAFKTQIRSDSEPFKQSIPSVFSGTNIQVNRYSLDNNGLLRLSGNGLSFILQLALLKKEIAQI